MSQTQDAHTHDAPPEPTSNTLSEVDAPDEYEAPAIVYRAPLEVTAAFCDPVAGGKTPLDSCYIVINS